MNTHETEVANGAPIDDDLYQRAAAAKASARIEALAFAENFFPNVHDNIFTDDIPLAFGVKSKNRIEIFRQRLSGGGVGDAAGVMALAIRVFEFAKRESSGFMRNLVNMTPGDDCGQFEKFVTPESYADSQGWANTAYNILADLSLPKDQLLIGLPICEFPSEHRILESLGVYWFFEAARLLKAGDGRAMDMLFESSDAFELANGLFMWDCGTESKTNHAAELAKRRHAEHYGMQADAMKYWRENINPSLSAAKAANELLRVVPLGHKKLAELVAAEKKKQR